MHVTYFSTSFLTFLFLSRFVRCLEIEELTGQTNSKWHKNLRVAGTVRHTLPSIFILIFGTFEVLVIEFTLTVYLTI